ncbi:MAG: glycoside hydrolase family 38 N-terminal domain-containing protein [Thermoguttaceae bacterium]
MVRRRARGDLSRLLLAATAVAWLAAAHSGPAAENRRPWTVYLAQDKHLDYNWCGSTTEIELRMAALVDYYLDSTGQGRTACWNLDSTLWDEVYRRHRGEAGSTRLREAIREGRIGYAGNYAVLLWGILDTETAIRTCYGMVPIEQATGVDPRTALVMENAGLTWGVANVLSECGFDFLGRGIYPLRAESYQRQRQPYPLFWWEAPNGQRILVHWDLYGDTKAWGGYAEGFRLSELAGVRPDAGRVQVVAESSDPGVFDKRCQYIRQTVARYEAYGGAYPISSILLLGTGHDGWICTGDLSAFVRRFNAASDGSIRMVDGRYQDFFEAAEKEIGDKGLEIPIQKGSFGICWEEWAAHLAGQSAQFREAQRLLRLAEAAQALEFMRGRGERRERDLIRHGFTELLKFAEHDFGGIDRRLAALSAAARAHAVTQALDIGRSLGPALPEPDVPSAAELQPEETAFPWRGGRVVFDPARCAIVSLAGANGRPWVEARSGRGLGELVATKYRSRATPQAVLPPAAGTPGQVNLQDLSCRRAGERVTIRADYECSGFQIRSRWLFHPSEPWIDVDYRLEGGWTDEPQSVEFAFPFALDAATYRYDAPGAILTAGPEASGGDDLPGANPELFAGVTFSAASGPDRSVLVIAPDTFLWRFAAADAPSAQIVSMPMMNLTGNDKQFGQGGQRQWTFRYRIVLGEGPFDPVKAVAEANRLAVPPFAWVPGQPDFLPEMRSLDLDFAGGPLLAFKVAEDDRRLILRFWNVRDKPVQGSLKLPSGWGKAQRCDALERQLGPLEAADGRLRFDAAARGFVTVALVREDH